jgi:hypothetical protein
MGQIFKLFNILILSIFVGNFILAYFFIDIFLEEEKINQLIILA